jgi:hypothetical protein
LASFLGQLCLGRHFSFEEDSAGPQSAKFWVLARHCLELLSFVIWKEIIVDFQAHLEKIHEEFRAKLEAVQSEVVGTAVALLQEDIQNPELNGADVPADAFMFRANQIGLALADNGYFAVAERLYRALVQETLRYRRETGNWRHAGALYANTAGACAAQRNLDRAVVELLKAAQDDVETYGVPKHKSFAITGLLQEYFGNPVRNEALKVVQAVNPTVTMADVEALSSLLGEREYALLAYAHLALVHEAANRQFPNEFSQLQIFSALRSLSSLLEVELKTIVGNMQDTLMPTLKMLYESKSWWQVFENKRIAIRATRNSNRPIDDQLKDAIAIAAADDDAGFWKSLLVAYIIRNYTTHQLETQCALVQSFSQEALGHILHVMVAASKHTRGTKFTPRTS